MIGLAAEGGAARLTVDDDGVGHSTEMLANQPEWGLHIMSYRASMIGGVAGSSTRRATAGRPLTASSRCKSQWSDSRWRQTSDDRTDSPASIASWWSTIIPIVRQGLALLINREPDLMVCGEAEEAQAALQAIATLQPDIVIVDISLNGPTASSC